MTEQVHTLNLDNPNIARVEARDPETGDLIQGLSFDLTVLDATDTPIPGTWPIRLTQSSPGIYEGEIPVTVAYVHQSAYRIEIVGVGTSDKVLGPAVAWERTQYGPSEANKESIAREAGII